MHDMQTGRFWQHDPLSEKYVHNSPYAFSENKVTGHVELVGLEAEAFMPAMMARMATTAATRPNSREAAAWGTGIGIGGSLYNMAAGIGHLVQAALGGLSGVPQAAATGAAMFQAAGDLAANGPQGYFAQSTAMSMQQQYGDLPGNMQVAATYAHIGTDIATAMAPITAELKLSSLNLGLRGGAEIGESGIEISLISKETSAVTHGYKYAKRVRMRGVEDPVSHNFPYSFDNVILNTKAIHKNNGYRIFQLDGSMNGKNGFFEIGLRKDNIIDHRFFRSINK